MNSVAAAARGDPGQVRLHVPGAQAVTCGALPPAYPKRVAWRTTSWLESTQVLGAPTASKARRDS